MVYTYGFIIILTPNANLRPAAQRLTISPSELGQMNF